MANPNEQEKAMRTKVKWKRFTEMEVDMIMPDPSPNGNIYHSAFEMNAARNGLTVPPKARAIFGYLVIMLYKNVNESNFREFSNKRFKALRAVAHDISDGHISVFNDVEDAICYRNSYGQNHQIRKAVLSAVLDQAIKETDSPEYYRILHEDPASCSILRRANFPTLIAVAEKLKNRVLGGSNKVVNAEISDKVDYYFDMHVK
ncbi:hypothetical protein ISN45_At04g033200 [Arabidopsis thaliana x Arabidopsis arenosa]|uniref:Uncharacterized protein n=2 Tax=Arabidopsis TaxID=3701 RepID=A0A178USE0_ARATH|nr:hypothetical protein ISN45_At04g033200 [Arabidopsis thaliana x Arabidopsis arenosa]OAO96768.1 hypothetical protein AXX17_AT4G35880 [Arabidopsis thaliana]